MDSKLFILITLLFSSMAFGEDSIETLVSSDTNSAFSGPESKLNFELAKDKKTAELKFKAWNKAWGARNSTTTSITVKSPFDENSGQSTSANLDGLSNSTTFTISFDTKRISVLEADEDLSEKNTALCQKYLLSDKTPTCSYGKVKSAAEKYIDAHSAEENIAICNAFGYDESKCSKEIFSEALAMEYAEKRSKLFAPHTSAVLFPVKVSLGKESFNYLDLTSFEQKKDRLKNVSASAGLGYLTNSYFAGVNLEYQESNKAGDKMSYCTPVTGMPTATQCSDLAFGEPTKTIRHNVSAELRFRSASENFAIGVKLTKDIRNKEETIEVPIYLLQSEQYGLNSGIRLGWNSDDKDILASIFFGTSFKFFE